LTDEEDSDHRETTILKDESAIVADKDVTCCWICFDDDSKEPYISPCNCIGSLKNIHLTCLKSWMNSKKITKLSRASVCYFWKNYECELCKKIYQLNLDH